MTYLENNVVSQGKKKEDLEEVEWKTQNLDYD